MTTGQLTPEQRATAGDFLGEDRNWGFGLAIDQGGRYGWDGGLGTSWSSDPDDGTVAILMTQRLPPSWNVFQDFWTVAHQRRF